MIRPPLPLALAASTSGRVPTGPIEAVAIHPPVPLYTGNGTRNEDWHS